MEKREPEGNAQRPKKRGKDRDIGGFSAKNGGP